MLCRKHFEISSTELTENYSLCLVTPSEDSLQPSKGHEPKYTLCYTSAACNCLLGLLLKAFFALCYSVQHEPAATVTMRSYWVPCWRTSERRGVHSQGQPGGEAARFGAGETLFSCHWRRRAGCRSGAGMPRRDAEAGCRGCRRVR